MEGKQSTHSSSPSSPLTLSPPLSHTRHYKITFLNAVQYVMDLGPDLRTQVDYVFALSENIISNKQCALAIKAPAPALTRNARRLTDSLCLRAENYGNTFLGCSPILMTLKKYLQNVLQIIAVL